MLLLLLIPSNLDPSTHSNWTASRYRSQIPRCSWTPGSLPTWSPPTPAPWTPSASSSRVPTSLWTMPRPTPWSSWPPTQSWLSPYLTSLRITLLGGGPLLMLTIRQYMPSSRIVLSPRTMLTRVESSIFSTLGYWRCRTALSVRISQWLGESHMSTTMA